MNLSGTLKNKAINFYKEKMDNFGLDYFEVSDLTFTSDGAITTLPFDNNQIESILSNRQESLILQGIQNTKELAKNRNLSKDLINKELNILAKAPRSFAYALFECLYKIIKFAKSQSDLEEKLKKFEMFRSYIASLPMINQVDLDIMIELFLAGTDYMPDDVKIRKETKFKVLDTDIFDFKTREIIALGEFIAPKRVPVIVRTIQSDNEITRYVAPIYFALKNDAQATAFLNSCKSEYCDNSTFVMNQAKEIGVPYNLRKMVLERKL